MTFPTHKKIPLIVCGFLTVLFLVLSIQGPAVIAGLYQKQSFALLDQLAGKQGPPSLGFYQGVIEDKWLGPLKQLVSGLAFAIFAFVFLQKSRTGVFILAVFLYFVTTRPEVLFFPPYGDAVGGPFAEAIWLKRNSFDYTGLAQQPTYIYGGPKVYLFTIFPGYMAALMKVIPSSKIFLFVNHLTYFLMAAAIVAYFRNILLKVFSDGIALLVSVLLLSLPLFQSQAEILNMEIPLLFFAILAVYFLVEKKVWLACLFSVLAASVKGVGVLICGSVFIVSLFLYLGGGPDTRFKWPVFLAGLAAAAFAVLQACAAFYVLNEKGNVPFTGLGRGWPSIRSFPVTYLYFASLVIFLTQYFKESRTKGVLGFWRENHAALIMFVTAGAWFGFFVNHMAVSPRYQLLLIPFSLFSIFYGFQFLVKSSSIIKKLLWVAIAFSFLCSYGLLYSPVSGNNHVLMERSLGYRNDMKLYLQVTREVEEKFSSLTIGAPFIMAQALALEELGYVHKGMDVMVYGMICQYGGIKNFHGLKYVNIGRTVWVGLLSDLPVNIEYPVSSQDKVMTQIYQGTRRATLFQGGIAIEDLRLKMEVLQKKNFFKTLDKL